MKLIKWGFHCPERVFTVKFTEDADMANHWNKTFFTLSLPL